MAVTDHVTIDLHLLESTAQGLGRVADTLGGSRATAEQDARALGQADLAAALSEFSDNWRVHREKLTDAVRGAQTFVSGAVDAYKRLDCDMAASVTAPAASGQPSGQSAGGPR